MHELLSQPLPMPQPSSQPPPQNPLFPQPQQKRRMMIQMQELLPHPPKNPLLQLPPQFVAVMSLMLIPPGR